MSWLFTKIASAAQWGAGTVATVMFGGTTKKKEEDEFAPDMVPMKAQKFKIKKTGWQPKPRKMQASLLEPWRPAEVPFVPCGFDELPSFDMIGKNVEFAEAPLNKAKIKAFTAWVNSHLIEVDPCLTCNDITIDLCDAIRLIKLIEKLEGGKFFQYTPVARLKYQKLQNMGNVVRYLKHCGCELVGIKSLNLVECTDRNAMLRIAWQIIEEYHEWGEFDFLDQEGIQSWVKNQVARADREYSVKDFKTCWSDGKVFGAICNSLCPNILDLDAFDGRTSKKNLDIVFALAEKAFEVPDVLDSTLVAEGHVVKECIYLYLSYFMNFMKHKGVKPAAKQPVGEDILEEEKDFEYVEDEGGEYDEQKEYEEYIIRQQEEEKKKQELQKQMEEEEKKRMIEMEEKKREEEQQKKEKARKEHVRQRKSPAKKASAGVPKKKGTTPKKRVRKRANTMIPKKGGKLRTRK